MITQYVLRTERKCSGWGWERYFKNKNEALEAYEWDVSDKSFSNVSLHKESFKKPGSKITHTLICRKEG